MNTARWALGWGLALCLAGVGFALALAPGPLPPTNYLRIAPPPGWRDPAQGTGLSRPGSPLETRYLRLDNWDSVHFFDIAMNGYRVPAGPITREDVHEYRANVTFLPAYPLLVGLFSKFTGAPGQLALLFVAQGFAVLFWALFLIWGIGPGLLTRRQALAVAAALFVYPSAFYLVAGYTESLFLAAMLGMILLTDHVLKRPRALGAILGAGVCGMLVTGSRIVGLPAILYPACLALGSRMRSLLAVFALSTLGVLGFFLYCEIRFGHWDLYFRLLEIGWGQANSFVAFLFDPRSYLPFFFFEDTQVSLNHLSVLICVVFLVRGARQDFAYWRDNGEARPLALRVTGAGLLYLAMAGKSLAGMDGMARYTLPVFVLIVMAHLSGEAERPRPARGLIFGLLALSLAFQLYLLRRYLLGHWVS